MGAATTKIPRKKKWARSPTASTAAGMRRKQRLERQLNEHVGKATARKFGGRPKGVQNYTSRMTQEAILEGLSRCGGREGLVGFVIAAVEDNIRNGVTMLALVTPRMVDAHITTHHESVVRTLTELDEDLAKRGLPSTQEIFRLDYGNGVLDEDEVVVLDNAT